MYTLNRESIEGWLAKKYPGSAIQELTMRSSEDFYLFFRCWHADIPMTEFCKVFVDRFSLFTMTNWTVDATFPHVQRYLYRKDYLCQVSGRNKKTTKTGQVKTKRNKDCEAQIMIKFKKITKNTLKNDKLLRQGLNVFVKIKFQHSHGIRTAEALNLLRCTPNTKQRMLEYIKMGIPPSDLKIFNEFYVRLAYYEPKLRELQLKNRMINPDGTKTGRFFYDWKKDNREYTFDSVKKLKEQKAAFEEKGIYIKVIENPLIVVVLTPLTKKIFNNNCIEKLFIDSTGIADKEIQYVTTFFVPTKLGALPIGYVIHNGESELEYEEGFKVLTASIADYCGRPLTPKVIITNDGEQTEELGRFFPTCRVELCPYANFTKFWTFIWDSCNSVNEDDRKRLMTIYYNIVTSQSKEECKDMFREVIQDSKFNQNECLVELFNGLWQTKDDWSDSTKSKLDDSDKITSTHMRVFKETVVRRIQKFNAYCIVKLLTEVLEAMYKKYLTSFIFKKKNKYPLFSVFYDKPVNFNILPLNDNEYMVQSLVDLDRVCTVYTDIIFCTCGSPTDGRNGAYCVHLKAVEYEFPFLPYPNLSPNEKEMYTFPEADIEDAYYVNLIEKTDDYAFTYEIKQQPVRQQTVIHKSIKIKKEQDYDTGNFDSPMEFDLDDNMGNDDMVNITDDVAHDPENDAHNAENDENSYNDDHIENGSDYDDDITEDYKPTIKKKISKCKIESKKKAPVKKQPKIKQNKKRKREQSPEEDAKPLRQSDEDEADIISKGWGIVYRGLTQRQKLFAKKAIDDILFEATLGTLKRNSVMINANVSELDPIECKIENFEGE